MGKGKQVQADQTMRQTNLPEYADPYFRRMLQGAEESLMPFYPDDPDVYGDLAGQSTYMPYQGERIAPSEMYGDINASRAMTRGIAESGIAGMPQAQGAARAGMDIQAEALGGLRGLANYDTGNFGMADTSSFADEFQAFQPNKYDGFKEAEFSKFDGFNEYNFRNPSEFSSFNFRPDYQFQQFQFERPEEFGNRAAQRYMSPYMDAVVAEQKRGAIQDFERQGASRDAAAVRAGAFGGSRQAVGDYLAEEGLQEQLGGIEASGRQQAFQQAQQQFGADRAARMEAEARQAGEFGRVQSGQASEQARVDQARYTELASREQAQAAEYARAGDQEAAERARIQASKYQDLARVQQGRANEMARVQAAQAAENARMDAIMQSEAGRVQSGRVGELGRAQGLTASELARVQQAEEASRQFGAGQGLAAYQAIGSGASNLAGLGAGLAGLGERQRASDIQGAQLLETIGRDIRAEDQGRLDLAYEDFIRQRDYPISQYERMAGILRGVPVTPNVEETRFANYNPIQQALGAGISGLGLYKGLTS